MRQAPVPARHHRAESFVMRSNCQLAGHTWDGGKKIYAGLRRDTEPRRPAVRSRFRLDLPTEGSPTSYPGQLFARRRRNPRSFVTDEPRSLNMACLESHLGFAGMAIAELKSVTQSLTVRPSDLLG